MKTQKKIFIIVETLFRKNDFNGSLILNKTLLVIIYLFGFFVWIRFLNFGDIPINHLDWADITYPRLHVIQQAVQQGKLPFYVIEENGLKGVTNLFLTIPDQILSPDVLLLRFLSIEQFIVVHILLFYSLGFWGLILFKRKYSLSFIAFLLMFFIFNFNGHIVSHLTVGHLTWASYFLFSFFFLFIFDLYKEQNLGWNWIAKNTILLLLILISGGYHQFVWIILFLFILLLVNKDYKKLILFTILFSLLVNFFRLVPAGLLSGKLNIEFMAGFPTSGNILDGIYKLSTLKDALFFDNTKVNILSWELNFYIGFLGLAFLIIFGIAYFKERKDQEINKLLIPTITFFFLSIGNFYKIFFDSGIPLLSGERISARFMIMPLLVLLFVSILHIQNMFSKNQFGFWNLGISLGIIIIANDLMHNLSEWSLEKVIEIFPGGDYSPLTLGSGDNLLFLGLQITGLAISTVSIIFLVNQLVKEHQ